MVRRTHRSTMTTSSGRQNRADLIHCGWLNGVRYPSIEYQLFSCRSKTCTRLREDLCGSRSCVDRATGSLYERPCSKSAFKCCIY